MGYQSLRIVDAIENINRTYFLPAIQREFVWDDVTRIEKLFDSIMCDYPIGTFLFWKLEQKNIRQWNIYKFLSNYDEEKSHNEGANVNGINKDIHLILDGQQRLTALNIGLKGSFRYFYYRWRTTTLYLNLLKEPIQNENNPEEPIYQFSFREDDISSDPQKELWYEVGNILSFIESEDAKLDFEPKSNNLSKDLKVRADKMIGKLHNRIHTLPNLNYYEERTQDYEKVLEIFVRANLQGVKLDYSDLLLSTATAKWKVLDARKEINEFTDSLNTIGAGYNFGKEFVLKACLYLTEDLPIQYKVKNFTNQNLIKIENNWDSIKSQLAEAIKLVSKFGFNFKNITSPNAILPISYFIKKKNLKNFADSTNKKDVEIQNDIQKWLILAFLKNAFASSTDTVLNNTRVLLQKTKPLNDFPIDKINTDIGITSSFTDEEIDNILTYQYQGKYTYLVLSLLFPDRDWKGYVFHEDHIYPATLFSEAKLKKQGYDKSKIEQYLNVYNTVLNLELLTPSENLSKNATPFDRWITTRDKNFKNRNSIPELKYYGFDNFLFFIEERKKILAAKMKTI
jgi:uncharacterized protein with ParB-like and HNH nuclease domain